MEKFEIRMTFDGENYAEKYYVNGDRVPKEDFYELMEDEEFEDLASELDLDTRREIMLMLEEELLIIEKCAELKDEISDENLDDVDILNLIRDLYESAYTQGKTDANLKVSKFLEEQE